MGTVIEFQDVWKVYQLGKVEVPALSGVSFKINKGDFVSITGKSGSGKSTVLNLVGCLDIPSKGKILLDGQDISKIEEEELVTIRGKKLVLSSKLLT